MVAFIPALCHAGDSLAVNGTRVYSSIGFQVSDLSGIGISIGYNRENSYRARFTGGIISADNNTYASIGFEYEVELTRNKPFRVFVGPGFGFRGQDNSDQHTTIGLGTGFEKSLTGNSIFENVSGGIEIYYPTYDFHSKSVWFAGGIFMSYNFQ